MPPKPTKLPAIVSSIITLLNNINDLVVISNRRKEARDVMKAIRIYAKNSNYILSDTTQKKMEHFDTVLLDSRPITVTWLVQDITQEILKAESIIKTQK